MEPERRALVKEFYTNLGAERPDVLCQVEMDPF